MSDQNQHNHRGHPSLGLLVLAGIGAGALTGVLLGLMATRRPRGQAQEAMTETVEDLKRRAEQILTELSQSAAAASSVTGT